MPEEKILGTTEAGVGLQRDSAQYTERAQARSATSEAATARAIAKDRLSRCPPARAPAPSSSGTTGIGIPAWSANTQANSIGQPYSRMVSTSLSRVETVLTLSPSQSGA